MKLTSFMVALVGTVVLASSASAEAPLTVEAALKARQAERWPILGAMADVGVPDGAIGSLVVRPWQWLRVYGGGGTNTVSKGWRGGLSLVPFGAGPSLSVEYGHYNDGDANGLVRRLMSSNFAGSPLLEKVGYNYANAHAGLDFGGKHVMFFVHGGVSMVQAQIHNVNDSLRNTTGLTTVSMAQDPKVKAYGSSLKIGLIIFLI
jgi:hypothetical protein